MAMTATRKEDLKDLSDVFRSWWHGDVRMSMTATEALASLRAHLEPNGYFIGSLVKRDPVPWVFDETDD